MSETEKSSSDPSKLINACPSCEQLLDVSAQDPYSKIQCPACQETIRVRTDFNHFQIEQQIGEGGMSRVFLAEDVALGRQNALKILNRQFSKDVRRTEQFEREATITASISHPNVVKVYSVGHDQAYFYIAMELVAKGSLDEMIQREVKVDEGSALKIGIEVARGLRAAHNAGLIHRDVKPGNILFAEDDTAKIVDFGLALMFETDTDDDGEIWATPYYVPPEKLSREPEDFRSDVYSLGATLFHALSGTPPFDADTTSVMELKRLKAKPVRLADYAPHVSAETCEVIDRAMAARPGERHGSYEELIEHLTYARKCVTRGRGSSVGKAPLKSKASVPKIVMGSVVGVAVAAALVAAMVGNSGKGGSGEGGGGSGIVNISGTDATIASRFLEARKNLSAGNVGDALASFLELSADESVPQPTLNWSRVNAGICLLLQGKESESRLYFRALNSGGGTADDPLEVLFDDLARVMDSGLEVDVAFADKYPRSSVRSVALLTFGLKNWEIGTFDSAKVFLDLFATSNPPSDSKWIEGYKGLVAPFIADLKILEAFRGEDRGGSYPELQRQFDEREAAIANFRVGHGLTAKAVENLEGARIRLAKMKVRYDNQEATRMATIRQAELEALRSLVQEIDGYRTDLKFSEGADVLKEANFESAGAKRACADQMALWKTAGGFLEQLIEDFNERGYQGEIYRGTAAPIRGKVIAAEGQEIKISQGSKESTVTFQEMTIPGLVKMAENILRGISDSDDYYRRREQIVSFTLLGKLPAGQAMAAELASEHPGFRERWERIKADGVLAGG